MGVRVERLESHDPRLSRHVEHDDRSRDHALTVGAIDRSAWVSKRVRIYDPLPNPNQTIGNCTGCAQMMLFNTVGNRVAGRVLSMPMAIKNYELSTQLDGISGTYPPDDTGSTGLAAAKASQQLGLGLGYQWIFDGADGVVQAIQQGRSVAAGTKWLQSMFTNPYSSGKPLEVTGDVAGGHEYVLHGYDASRDYVLGRCWWGTFRDFWIRRTDLDNLLRDSGDAHVQTRAR
jgi:hypothetical protein